MRKRTKRPKATEKEKALARRLVAGGRSQRAVAEKLNRSREWVSHVVHSKPAKPSLPKIIPYDRRRGYQTCPNPECGKRCYLPLPQKRPGGLLYQPPCIACQVRAALQKRGGLS